MSRESDEFGIRVGAGSISGDPPVCPTLSVQDFTLRGMRIANADDTGLFMIGVDGFHVSGGRYLDNAEYGSSRAAPATVSSTTTRGAADRTRLSTSASIDQVAVEKNNLTNGELGIELENTRNSYVAGNKLGGNVTGILVVVLPDLPTTSTENAVIERNVIRANNLPNPAGRP